MKNLLMVTAIIEAGAGLVFFMMPSVAAILLFGSSLDMPAAMAVGRLAGAALITLGVACWLVRSDAESRATTGLVNALLLYNLAALVILAAAGFAWGLVGILLWLGVILHSVMAVWCFTCLRVQRHDPGNKE